MRINFRNVTAGTNQQRYAWDRRGTMLADFDGLDSNVRIMGSNGHGDIVWTASATGAITRTRRFDPWGGVLATSGSGFPGFGFQGSWIDADTGVYWVVTRWYAPDLGRFISEDALLGEPRNPRSRHLYAYAEGDPVNGWDPDGRESKQLADYLEEAAYVYGKFGWDAGDRFAAYTVVAWRVAKQWFSGAGESINGGLQDACRHCIWSGALARARHIGYVNAIIITRRHDEWGPGASRREVDLRAMDLYNNQVGRTTSLWFKKGGESEDIGRIARECRRLAEAGKLSVLNPPRR